MDEKRIKISKNDDDRVFLVESFAVKSRMVIELTKSVWVNREGKCEKDKVLLVLG